jgi:hypothetical protein
MFKWMRFFGTPCFIENKPCASFGLSREQLSLWCVFIANLKRLLSQIFLWNQWKIWRHVIWNQILYWKKSGWHLSSKCWKFLWSFPSESRGPQWPCGKAVLHGVARGTGTKIQTRFQGCVTLYVAGAPRVHTLPKGRKTMRPHTHRGREYRS